MKILFYVFLIAIFSQVFSASMPIGGSLDNGSHILNLFFNKTVAFITAAGPNPVSDAQTMQRFFDRRGIKAIWVPVYAPCRNKVRDQKNIDIVEAADAIFFSGGYSGKLQQCMFGDAQDGSSPLLEAILKKPLVTGSSAGAMVQPHSNLLITEVNPDSYRAVVNKQVHFRPHGLKIFKKGLVDSHFSERGRQGRLFVLAWQTKSDWAFGVDENTGILEVDGKLRVIGQNGVVVFQNSHSLTNGTVHFLTEGDVIDENGNIHFPSWKIPCGNPTPPKPSRNIFYDFRARSLEVATYNQNIEYKGHVGSNPVVEVTLKRRPTTKVGCGKFNGTNYVSFTNMFVSMTTKTADELGFVGFEHFVPLHELDD